MRNARHHDNCKKYFEETHHVLHVKIEPTLGFILKMVKFPLTLILINYTLYLYIYVISKYPFFSCQNFPPK